jgi:hypothetical protein
MGFGDVRDAPGRISQKRPNVLGHPPLSVVPAFAGTQGPPIILTSHPQPDAGRHFRLRQNPQDSGEMRVLRLFRLKRLHNLGIVAISGALWGRCPLICA